MNQRALIIAGVALLVLVAAAFGYSLTRGTEPDKQTKAEIAERQKERIEDACGSKATYDRLKEVVFEEAIRVRNADPANLDTLAAHSVVRMENPVVKSRDEGLNVTVCSGRFVLELPPGAERGFGGERRLTADVEYAAQAAADGSGLVYQMNGAEPIIYKLATFDLQGQRYTPPNAPDGNQLAAADVPAALPVPEPAAEPQPRAAEPPPPPPAPAPAPAPAPRAEPAPRAQPERRAGNARPSFNCRHAGTRSERMVCGSERLASLDRSMSSLFYSALADADGRTRAELRRTRDRFLAYRERCRSESCVAGAYRGRMEEIRDIMAEAD